MFAQATNEWTFFQKIGTITAFIYYNKQEQRKFL